MRLRIVWRWFRRRYRCYTCWFLSAGSDLYDFKTRGQFDRHVEVVHEPGRYSKG